MKISNLKIIHYFKTNMHFENEVFVFSDESRLNRFKRTCLPYRKIGHLADESWRYFTAQC